jgi:hypothetical protein
MRHTTTRRSVATGLLALLVVGSGTGAASAKGGHDHERRATGSCSAATDWKLKVKQDDRRLEVELEIDANRTGQRWHVSMSDNGHRLFEGSRVTHGRSGSFEIERSARNRPGVDRIRAVASNARTGEHCTAVLRYHR